MYLYNKLPKQWKKEAKKQVLQYINTLEHEQAIEQERKEMSYTINDEFFNEILQESYFEIETDEETKEEKLYRL